MENNSPLHAINFYLLASVQAIKGILTLFSQIMKDYSEFHSDLKGIMLAAT
jgi:hypothetical protein